MKKKVFATVLSMIMVVFVLTACGNEPAVSSSEKSQGAKTEEDKMDQNQSSGSEKASAGNREQSFKGQELVLYTWEGMFPDEVLSNFEEKTGCKIVYQNFTYDEEMLEKLNQTKGGEYDLVIADDYIIEQAVADGLVKKLDKSLIPNYENQNPMFQGQFFDKNNEYTVNYGAGIPLIVYDPQQVDFEIKGYEDLWNEKLKDSIAITANYRVIDGITLLSMGESMNTEDVSAIQKAGEKLLKLAPNIRLIKDDNTQTALLTGEASVAFLYTSQVNDALTTNPDLKVVIPEEGVGFGVMAGFIPSQAPNSELAHAFLNYLLEPEVSASCFEFMGYYCTTKTAEPLIPEDNRDLLVVPEGLKGEMVENVSAEANDAYEKIWTEFKAATGNE